MLDPLPGKLADVEQAIQTSNVNEGSEIENFAYNPFNGSTNFQISQSLLAAFF